MPNTSVAKPSDIHIIKELATKVMGWVVPDGCSDWYTADKIKTGRFKGQRERRADMSWDPTTSIADAFQIVEKLQEMGWTVTLALRQFEGQARDRNIFHGCRMVGSPQKMTSFCARAETPCRAICLAAIDATWN